jgi:hypothetical protein
VGKKPREGWVEIDANGDVRATPAAMRQLASAAGLWRPLPSAGQLLVLQPVDDAARTCRQSESQVLVCGAIDARGTLPAILHLVHMSHWEGALFLESGPVQKVLFFRKGTLLSARSNQPEDLLGALLVRLGWISQKELSESLAQVSEQVRLGQALVADGRMTTAQVYDGIQRQCEEIFFSVLLMTSGSYYFVQPLNLTDVPSMLHLDVEELLLRGFQRLDEMGHLKTIVPSIDVVMHRVGEPPVPGTVEGNALRLYDTIDGARTLGDVMATVHLDEFAATKAAAELVQRGCVEIAPPDRLRRPRRVADANLPGDAASRIVDAYNEALRRLSAALQDGMREHLCGQLQAYLQEKEAFQPLFDGVRVESDGALMRQHVFANLDRMALDDRMGMLQLGLNELLFFALFAVGDNLDRATEEAVQREVARVLSTLPS